MPVSLNERIAHPLANKLSLKSLRDNDLGLGVSNPYAQDVFNILSKFGNDAHMFVPGVGYLNGFAAGNYIESTGNTNASVDGAVGLVLDAAGSVGAELSTTQSATLTGSTGNVCVSTLSVIAGKAYKVSYRYSLTSGAIVASWMTGASSQNSPSSGAYSGVFVASGSGAVSIYSAAGVGSVSEFSVREVTGTHATQATTANKPTLRRGIVNLLTDSYSPTAGSADNAGRFADQSDPKGGNGAVLLTENALGGFHRLVRAPYSVPAGALTVAAVVKRTSGTRNFGLKLWDGLNDKGRIFDLGSGSPLATIGAYTLSEGASVGDLGGGWFLCVANVTAAAGTGDITYGMASSTNLQYGGDGSSSIAIFGTGLFQGTLTAQQIIAAGGIPLTTTAPASSQYGIGEPVLGPELINTSAWTLAQPTAGSVTNVSGTITINSTDGTYAAATQGASEIGVAYSISGTASALSGNGVAIAIGAANYVPAAGPFSCVLIAPTISPIEIRRANGIGAGTVSGLTVKKITGYKSLPNSYAWQFDGADDSLSLQGALFQITDDHCVVAAGVASIDASARVMFAQGAVGQSSRVPTMYNASGVATVGWRDNSGAGPNINAGTLAQNQPFVIAARKVGSTVMARLNGGATVSATNQTWGVTTCNAATIGALPVGGATWNSLLYPMIIIKGTVSEAEEKAMIKLLGSIAGVPIA